MLIPTSLPKIEEASVTEPVISLIVVSLSVLIAVKVTEPVSFSTWTSLKVVLVAITLPTCSTTLRSALSSTVALKRTSPVPFSTRTLPLMALLAPQLLVVPTNKLPLRSIKLSPPVITVPAQITTASLP